MSDWNNFVDEWSELNPDGFGLSSHSKKICKCLEPWLKQEFNGDYFCEKCGGYLGR